MKVKMCKHRRLRQLSMTRNTDNFNKNGTYHERCVWCVCVDGICNQAAYDVITELCEDCDWETMRKGDPY